MQASISISPEVLSLFPDVQVGVCFGFGIDNSAAHPQIESKLRSEEGKQRELLTGVEIPSLPEIKVWRDAYKAFGSDPRDYRSSIEALLRRARAGNKPLPIINPLVDLYNYLSLKYHLPIGAEDLNKIVGPVTLSRATGTESGLCLGDQAPQQCDPGEVIYRDDQGFICRRWNWREADRTKIEAHSTNVVVVVDTVGGENAQHLDTCMSELLMTVQSELGGTWKSSVISRSSARFSIG